MGKMFMLVLASVFLVASSAMAEEIRVGSGAAATENIFKKIQPSFEQATGLKLIVEASGPVDGFKKMDVGGLDAVVVGVSFVDLIAMLEKDGYAVADKAAYTQEEIGKDIIKVIINKSVTVTSLSKEQLKGIFTGKITNWNEVGGSDMDIGVVFGKQIPGTQNTFKKAIMDGEEYATDLIEVATAADVKKKVIDVPGAVGLAPLSLADDTVTVPQMPEVGRPIVLVTKGAPKTVVQTMLDYIKGAEGQSLIVK